MTKLIFIKHDENYKYFDETEWISVGSTVSEEVYLNLGMTSSEIENISELQWAMLDGIKTVSVYESDEDVDEITVETETEPFSIYEEFGDSMEVLYYTDDTDKSEAELEITANYSPLDELEGDFEVVTWTDETDTQRVLELDALPHPQFIKQVNPNNINGTISDFLSNETFTGVESGVIRYFLSPDKNTWKSWNGDSFINVDTTNIITDNGMDRETIQSLTAANWGEWADEQMYLGIYIDDDVRGDSVASIDSISYKDLVPKESTRISDAKLYILNTVSTIDVSFKGSTITGEIDDEDEGKVQYRIILNDNNYFPADGEFTPLMASPLNISTTLSNEDILIDENNTLRIEFKDYWGSVDYWETNFTGTYSGLLFLDETGEYYSTDIGGILQYLDFGVIIAGQTTIEQAILLRNTYGYTVDNISIRANQTEFPEGMRAQFGTSGLSFEALDSLLLEGQMEDGDERTFYIRLSTQLGVTPQANGEFDIIVTADKVEEIEE